MVAMLVQTMAALTVLGTAMAHPHVHPHFPRHGRHHAPSEGGDAVMPTGGMYYKGNSSSVYLPTGTGIGLPTGTGVPDEVTNALVADTQDVPAEDAACDAYSRSTFTVYETEFVTMTRGSENTAVVPTAPATTPVSSPSASNFTVTSKVLAEDTPASLPADASASTETSADVADVSGPGPAPAGEGDSEDSAMSSIPPAKTEPDAQTNAAQTSSATLSSPSSKADTYAAFYEVPSASSGKRGLAYNSAKLTNAFADKAISWAYNWAAAPSGELDSKFKFVPMLWGEKMFDGWKSNAQSSLDSGATHMLSFNEPDLPEQANMDTATAAAAHIKHMNPFGDKVKIGSPAVTGGGPEGGSDGLGLAWLEKFLKKCDGGCKVDFLAIHWYDSASSAEYLKKHVLNAIELAKKYGISKVWLTEFGASGSDDEIVKFLDDVLPWLDSTEGVERYAYFMCAEGHLLKGGALADPVGKAYAA